MSLYPLFFATLLAGCGTLAAPNQSPPPGTLTIAAPAVGIVGQSMVIEAVGASPGESVNLVGSLAGVGPGACPSVLGGECLGVSSPPLMLGVVTADALGRATWVLDIPPHVRHGAEIGVQAWAVRGSGSLSSVPDTIRLVTSLDADGDGALASVDCDDNDAQVYPGAVERCDGVDNDCDPTTDESGTITMGQRTFRSLERAIGASSPGDELVLCSGTFVGEDIPIDHRLTIRGAGAALTEMTAPAGSPWPILYVDGTAAGRLTLKDMRVTGRGIQSLDGRLTVESVRMGPLDGHAIHAEGDGTLTITDSHFDDINFAVRVDGPYSFPTPGRKPVVITNTVFENNRTGLFVENTELTVEDSRFVANVSSVRVHESQGTFRRSQFTRNDTVMRLWDNAQVAIRDSSVTHNNDNSPCGASICLHDENTRLNVVDSDFGVNSTDNLDDDIFIESFNGTNYWNFGRNSTFTCRVNSTGYAGC